MFGNEVMTGSRCPHKIGQQFRVPISESEAVLVECYHIIPETGAGLCKSADGQHRFRVYAYGWSKKSLENLPKAFENKVENTIFYKDLGLEVFH